MAYRAASIVTCGGRSQTVASCGNGTLRASRLFFESSSRSKLCLEHDLVRKPVSTFRDHALGPKRAPHVGQGLLAGALVAGAVGFARPRHGGSDRLHLLRRDLAKPGLGLRDRVWRRLTMRRGCGALARGRPGGGVRVEPGVD